MKYGHDAIFFSFWASIPPHIQISVHPLVRPFCPHQSRGKDRWSLRGTVRQKVEWTDGQMDKQTENPVETIKCTEIGNLLTKPTNVGRLVLFAWAYGRGWPNLAMDSLKFHPGLLCLTLLRPAGGQP
jgi:hypothetical protein